MCFQYYTLTFRAERNAMNVYVHDGRHIGHEKTTHWPLTFFKEPFSLAITGRIKST